VSRQPILSATGQVFGYELLCRVGGEATWSTEQQDLAAARVISDAVLALGLETLTGGRRAFMNMSRAHLIGNVASLLPPKAVVIEVIEKANVDAEVVEVCKGLRARGYSLALEDFVLDGPATVLLPYANFIKINTRTTTAAQFQAIRRSVPTGASLIAENVETAERYDELRTSGYHLFQGYYFCKPTMFKTGALSARRMAYAQLLTVLNDANVTVDRVENLVKHDASLSYKVLRCVNSAAYGIQREIQSIRQAVVLLGLEPIKKWASVWALAGLNEGSSPERVNVAILRARSCELIAQTLMSNDDAAEYFLLGMCSLLDVILQKPMEEALNDLPLSQTVHKALLGEENLARFVLDAVIAYERGLWDEAARLAEMAGFTAAQLPVAYADSLRWARELTSSAKAA
jgi:EAL and modified HD-GYP domain-containing signal transduction protein